MLFSRRLLFCFPFFFFCCAARPPPVFPDQAGIVLTDITSASSFDSSSVFIQFKSVNKKNTLKFSHQYSAHSVSILFDNVFIPANLNGYHQVFDMTGFISGFRVDTGNKVLTVFLHKPCYFAIVINESVLGILLIFIK